MILLSFVDQHFMIKLKSSASSAKDHSDLISKLYNGWLMRAAHPIFKNKVEEMSSRVGVDKPRKIVIKKLKNRWGSLTPSGTINLNVNLLKAPSDIIDYIILHELCHFKIKEHSHHYWDLVRMHIPDYEKKVNWLNVNATILL